MLGGWEIQSSKACMRLDTSDKCPSFMMLATFYPCTHFEKRDSAPCSFIVSIAEGDMSARRSRMSLKKSWGAAPQRRFTATTGRRVIYQSGLTHRILVALQVLT